MITITDKETMNKERLHIENFLGIKNIDIEIKNITTFIGEQAVGKSIILKTVFFFRKLSSYLSNYILNDIYLDDDITFEKHSLKLFQDFFSVVTNDDSCPKGVSKISYQKNKYKHEILISDKIEINYDIKINNIVKELIEASNDYEDQLEIDIDKSINNEKESKSSIISSIINKYFDNELLLFIPAGRSFFANINSNIWNTLNSDSLNLDPVYKDFASNYESFKNFYHKWGLNSDILLSTFNSKYVNDSGKDYLIHEDERKIEINRSSSGQQELLPLAIFLEVLIQANITSESTTIFIEEPEAHLFPKAQKDVVYKIIEAFNKLNSDKTQIFLTTHSPYIMSSFNNLIYAGDIIKNDSSKAKEVYEVIDPKYIISPDLIDSYYLDGTSHSIIEENIINAKDLDSISKIVRNDFSKLMELEY